MQPLWMKGTPADAFRALVEREGIVVEFGQGSEASVALSDRVVLPVETAKRLVLALNESLARHAPRLRSAEDALRGQTPVNAPPDQAGAKAALLLRLVSELDAPHQHERSFRLSAAGLLANRFLLTLNTRDIRGDARARVLGICAELGMPDRLRQAAGEKFAMAACLHFGFEGGPGSILCKLYLERAIPAEEARRARERGEPLLLHLAFKWDLLTAAEVVTEYLWYPGLDAAGIEARLAQVYRGGEPAASFEIAKGTLALAAQRVAAERLQYLEVQEANGRSSFDLNVYDAALQVKDLQPLLQRMREHYAVPPGRFQALYDQIKTQALGHVAGGVHRNGRDFFNLYYGVSG
jgi:tryptophan halogenase